MPYLDRLSEDTSEHVRAALSSVVLSLAPVLGQQATINQLLPLFLRLLKDQSAQVRLNIISKLEAVNRVVGLKMLSQSLLPAIMELSSDKQWRVRLAIIEFMPLLAQQLGAEFFVSELLALCIKWLSDSVFSIREAATVNLRKLTEVFGPAWAEASIIPGVLTMQDDGNYLFRLTALNAALVSFEARACDCAVTRLLTVDQPPAPSFRPLRRPSVKLSAPPCSSGSSCRTLSGSRRTSSPMSVSMSPRRSGALRPRSTARPPSRP
jgi:serine/threonine-protein phosphatase 2A regulatory subunit A